MARRRLNTILATTTLAAGLSVAPAWGQSLGDVTDVVEETSQDSTEAVTDTTETVEETTQPLADPVEQTSEAVESTLDTSGDGGTDETDGSDDTDDAGESDEPDDTDTPLEVDLEADVEPEDADGSPQLEVDGGVSAGDEKVDVGSMTDPIEDAVDPDPAPGSGHTGPDDQPQDPSRDGPAGTGPGGFLEGDGVTAAGNETRSADVPGSGSSDGGHHPSGRTVGESFAAFAAGSRGSDWSGAASDPSSSTTASSDITPPQVAGEQPFEQFPASQVDEPTVMATPATTGDPASPMAGLLKALAALMVLGTGIAFKRTLEEA